MIFRGNTAFPRQMFERLLACWNENLFSQQQVWFTHDSWTFYSSTCSNKLSRNFHRTRPQTLTPNGDTSTRNYSHLARVFLPRFSTQFVLFIFLHDLKLTRCWAAVTRVDMKCVIYHFNKCFFIRRRWAGCENWRDKEGWRFCIH